MYFQVSLVVSTTDCRKQPLVFKASIYELRSDLLLVEFRRSSVSQPSHWLFSTYSILHVHIFKAAGV